MLLKIASTIVFIWSTILVEDISAWDWLISTSDSSPQLQANFTIEKYVGKWYEIYRTENIPFESGSDITANYSINDDGTIKVLNRQYLPDKKEWHEGIGNAWVKDESKPAQLTVKFKWYIPGGDYRVLKTDYKTFSVVYSDTSFIFGLIRQTYAWILARTPQISEQTAQEAFEVLSRVNLNRDDFIKTPHGQAPTGVVA